MAARIPAWKGKLLNLAGRATLTAVTLSAVPTHTAIAVCLSPWAVGQIDKKRRAFLWSGSDTVAARLLSRRLDGHMPPKGTRRTRPRRSTTFRVALQLRWELQRRLVSDHPWVPLPTPENKILAAAFHAATDVVLGDGRMALFWMDRWTSDGRLVRDLTPNLLLNVTRRHRWRTVAQALDGNAWVRDIARALLCQCWLNTYGSGTSSVKCSSPQGRITYYDGDGPRA